jgi:hypothetical protein
MHISILTYAQASLVMLAILAIPLGAVKVLLGLMLTSSKSMFSVCATTWATCEHYVPSVTVRYTLNDGVNTVKWFSDESGMNTHEFLHCYVRFIADKTKYMFMSRDQTAG